MMRREMRYSDVDNESNKGDEKSEDDKRESKPGFVTRDAQKDENDRTYHIWCHGPKVRLQLSISKTLDDLIEPALRTLKRYSDTELKEDKNPCCWMLEDFEPLSEIESLV